MMKQIQLTRGQFATVDDEDFDRLSKFKWHTITPGTVMYAQTRLFSGKSGTKGELKYMHRMIMNAPPGMVVDHIDGDGLNNSKKNLRICTQKNNCANRGANKNSASGIKGVTYCKQTGKWRAVIEHQGKQKSLGRHSTIEGAKSAYQKESQMLHGEFARVV